MVFNHENRLAEVLLNGVTLESYLYDDTGQRVKKTSNGAETFYLFPHYEVEVNGSTTTETKYYYFNGQRVAMRKGGVLTYLHGDHLGSTSMTTDTSGSVVEQQYFAYGRQRGGGTLPTDHTFTGQKQDASGLQYFNARYYDPELGTFVSPDTLVPDPTKVYDYHRYMFVRGNPLRYNDPSGHLCETASLIDITQEPAQCIGAGGAGGLSGGEYAALAGAGAFSGVAALIGLTSNLAENPPPSEVTTVPGSTVTPDPLQQNPQPVIVTFPLTEQAQETTIPPASGVFNNTLDAPGGFTVVTPSAQDHIYTASRANTTVEIVGKQATYTLTYDSEGYPDFSPYAIAEVKIIMKGNYTSDFTQANKAAGFKQTPAGYTWHHHQDGETMQLVPTDLHKRVYHHGGVRAVKKE